MLPRSGRATIRMTASAAQASSSPPPTPIAIRGDVPRASCRSVTPDVHRFNGQNEKAIRVMSNIASTSNRIASRRSSSTSSSCPHRRTARHRRGDEHGPDGTDARRAQAADRRRRARRAARLWGHELDARRRARGGAGGNSSRTRRGRHALVRSCDARGGQPVLSDHLAALLLCSSQTAVEEQPRARVGRR